MIDELLKYNREFVKNKGYERFITNKYPDKKIADCVLYGHASHGVVAGSFRHKER